VLPSDFQRPKESLLTAKQENHNDDDEQEANGAAADIEGTAKNWRE